MDIQSFRVKQLKVLLSYKINLVESQVIYTVKTVLIIVKQESVHFFYYLIQIHFSLY